VYNTLTVNNKERNMTKPKITARKYLGDDQYSWAVFKDGRPVVTGLTRREVAYYKKLVAEGTR
jgi:hypothetical protein